MLILLRSRQMSAGFVVGSRNLRERGSVKEARDRFVCHDFIARDAAKPRAVKSCSILQSDASRCKH